MNEYKGNIRKTWKVINIAIGKLNDKASITNTFLVNGTEITDTGVISEKFCDYFTNIGIDFANKIPPSHTSANAYMTKSKFRNPQSMFLAPTDQNEILGILNGLKAKNSTGHDNLSSKLFKSLGQSVTRPISMIVNKSMESGVVPDNMKKAKVIPLYKAKSKNEFANYRPISLLPTISKIIEKVLHQ